MMVTKFLKIVFFFSCLVVIAYLALPGYAFPDPPPGSLQSEEPADLETPLRRGYFTNMTRAEVLSWYGNQVNHSSFFGIKLPTLLLNYPPEDAQTLIRDQTGSTFLQQFVHPFRESWYVNGSETPATHLKPKYFVEGKSWQLKIIIRYVPSNIFVREAIFIVAATLIVVLYKNYEDVFKKRNDRS